MKYLKSLNVYKNKLKSQEAMMLINQQPKYHKRETLKIALKIKKFISMSEKL